MVFDWPQNAHPSPEMVECLRQIAELTKHHDVLAQATSELRAQQRETSEEMRRMEGGLRDEVYKQQLRIPEDLQDQLDELKRGNAVFLASWWLFLSISGNLVFEDFTALGHENFENLHLFL